MEEQHLITDKHFADNATLVEGQTNMEHLDLLNPSDLRDHYQHLLRQTISAYSPTQIALGEVLQNALDAIVEVGNDAPHDITINLDLDQSTITITDTG